jgi:hypothetical protein
MIYAYYNSSIIEIIEFTNIIFEYKNVIGILCYIITDF